MSGHPKKKCSLFFLPLVCLSPGFSKSDFLAKLQGFGFSPSESNGGVISFTLEGFDITLEYTGGVIRACSESEKALKIFRKTILDHFLLECRDNPEVILVLSDGKQIEAYPEMGLGSWFFQATQNLVPVFLITASVALPILFSLYGIATPLLASLVTIMALLVFLSILPLVYRGSSCIRVPRDSKTLFLVRVQLNGLSSEDVTLLAIVKHILSRERRVLDEERIKRLLDDIGLSYERVTVEEISLADILQSACKKVGVKADLCIVPSSQRNAYALGLIPKLARIYLTVGLLLDLSQREVEAVLAHELAHLKNRHILKVFSLLSLEYIVRTYLITSFYVLFPVIAVYLLAYMYVVSRLLWRIEFAADREAAQASGAENLVSALVKLEYPALLRSEKPLERLKSRCIPSSHPHPLNRILYVLSLK
jgi:heat shock protein HtpX